MPFNRNNRSQWFIKTSPLPNSLLTPRELEGGSGSLLGSHLPRGMRGTNTFNMRKRGRKRRLLHIFWTRAIFRCGVLSHRSWLQRGWAAPVPALENSHWFFMVPAGSKGYYFPTTGKVSLGWRVLAWAPKKGIFHCGEGGDSPVNGSCLSPLQVTAPRMAPFRVAELSPGRKLIILMPNQKLR